MALINAIIIFYFATLVVETFFNAAKKYFDQNGYIIANKNI